jgi:hypothetical protein
MVLTANMATSVGTHQELDGRVRMIEQHTQG